MKEKILKMIKDGLGKTSLSERTLSQYAERKAAKYTKDEDITSELAGEWVADLKDVEGQLSHDVADKVKELEKEVERLKGLAKVGKGGNDPKDPKTNDPDMPKWFEDFSKKQSDEIASLKKRLDDEREESALSSFRSQMKAALKENGAKHEYFVDVVVGRISKEDSAGGVEGKLEAALSEYDKEVTKALGDGASPRSSVASGNNDVDKNINAFFEKKKAEREKK